ncbi:MULTISPECIES: carbohydrate ABC transporter permease [Paenibacillus]|uniref:Sugar ABC transporter permease n=1 Tax=Paenibacillus baimaensis TaxID=2982185 RepID=A0ABT2UGS5_9BACL|nr:MULTISPECIES: sugar ABC transporter permease [unclassified Paenibacillus]MCU6793838.1 sugar ABC transporter permease [Paenibacillus sp. WQ 127069]
MASRWYKEFWGFFFIAPFLIVFLAFEIYPFLDALYLSLFDYGIGQKEWVGLSNYTALLKDEIFVRSILNTFGLVLGVVPVSVFFSIVAASLIIGKSAAIASFFRASFYLPIVTSQVILSVTWLWIYNPVSGIGNYGLSLVGVKPVMWLADSDVSLIAVIIVVITWCVGQPIILYLAALGNIPSSYYEAASIDGASPWKQFWNITLPLLKPTTLYVIVTTTIGAFQTFVVVQLLTGGGPSYSTTTIMYLLYETAFKYGNLGLASAMGVVLAVLISIFSVVQFKFFKTDVEY